ncbi:MAG: hypothetical protein M1826_000412 [Phylliscum demangeonii]|nr:MAG: hypothetical protein M1826_000412 [Phylliscum demangeonii]
MNTSRDELDEAFVDSNAQETYPLQNLSQIAQEEDYLFAPGAEEIDEEGANAGHDGSFKGHQETSAFTGHIDARYTPEEESRVVEKFDQRLVLFIAFLYMLSFLDRSRLERDLKLDTSQFELLLSAFYVTYVAFEWMTLLYRIVPAHIYIPLCVMSWGLIASLQALTTSFWLLLVLRMLLGVGEAAFSPGLPFYLSFFYRREELAFRTGLVISAAPLASSFAGSLAWVITRLGQGGPIAPWRLLFLVEGFPSVLIAVFAWRYIPDSPSTAPYLSSRERVVAKLRLRKERGANNSEGGGKGSQWREILGALCDPFCYFTAVMLFSCNVAFSSLPVFLPTIIHDMGYSTLSSQALSAPPYLLAFVTVLVSALISDRFRSRGYVICFHSMLAALGYGVIAVAGARGWGAAWRYAGVYPAATGFFSAVTIIITWTINNQRSDTRKGAGLAMLNMIGQCAPFLGVRLYPEADKPLYVRGMAICSAFMLLVAVLALVLRRVLGKRNTRIERAAAAGQAPSRSEVEDAGHAFHAEKFRYML